MSLESGLLHHSKEVLGLTALAVASGAVVFVAREASEHRKVERKKHEVVFDRELIEGNRHSGDASEALSACGY